MFVHDFVTLDRPHDVVAAALVADRGVGTVTAAAVAAASAPGPDDAAEAPRFEVGEARSVGETVVVPIRWTPAPGRAAFRHLEGSLHVEPFGTDGSYLGLSASWDEPPTGLGRREDTRRSQRHAEMDVRRFLRELVARLRVPTRR